MKFRLVENKNIKNLMEDSTMPKFHMVFTVDGVKSEQDVSAVNVQRAEELIRKQYDGKSINFMFKQEIKDINEDVEDPSTVKEDAVEESERVPQTGEEVGLSNMIIQEINGEWETIQHYNDLITLMRSQGYDDMVDVISDIVAEENTHIGQLQKCLQVISPNVSKIEAGETEAMEQLSNEEQCLTCTDDAELCVEGDCNFIPDDDFESDERFSMYLV
jgi:hypothetical protein